MRFKVAVADRYLGFKTHKLDQYSIDQIGIVGIIFQMLVSVVVAAIVVKMVLAIVVSGFKNIQKKQTADTRSIIDDLTIWALFWTMDGNNLTGGCLRWLCQKLRLSSNALRPLMVYRTLQTYSHLEEICIEMKKKSDKGRKLSDDDDLNIRLDHLLKCESKKTSHEQTVEMLAKLLDIAYDSERWPSGSTKPALEESVKDQARFIVQEYCDPRYRALVGEAGKKPKAKKD